MRPGGLSTVNCGFYLSFGPLLEFYSSFVFFYTECNNEFIQNVSSIVNNLIIENKIENKNSNKINKIIRCYNSESLFK